MLGYIGLVLLLFSYVLLITKWQRWFIPIDIIASSILTIHAVIIKDIPFIIVNGFIAIVLVIKLIKKELNV